MAETLVDKLNQNSKNFIPHAALIPMDGFHLDNDLLRDQGLLERKGSPETFDTSGFCEAIEKATHCDEISFYPQFDRVDHAIVRIAI